MPETNGTVTLVKNRIKELLKNNGNLKKVIDFDVSLSIGCAYWDPAGAESLEEIFNKADMAMYEAKRKSFSNIRSGSRGI